MTSVVESGRRGIPLRAFAWVGAGCLLLVPLVAMQFTQEVRWTAFDFIAMGVLLFGSLGIYEVAVRLSSNTAYRVGAGLGLLGSVLLVWINGAVGIIGDGPINALYLAVLLAGAIGAAMGRLQPLGMARAMVAMAVTQMVVPVIALVAWKTGWTELMTDPDSPHSAFAPGVIPVFLLNGVFATLFAGSAMLFREAARRGGEPGVVKN